MVATSVGDYSLVSCLGVIATARRIEIMRPPLPITHPVGRDESRCLGRADLNSRESVEACSDVRISELGLFSDRTDRSQLGLKNLGYSAFESQRTDRPNQAARMAG